MAINHRLLLSVAGVLVLSACGGGGSTPVATQLALSGVKQGFISIEERSNKRVLDGWFSQGSVPELAQSELWQAGDERCVSLLPETASSDTGTRVGSRWQDTIDAGDFVLVQSRGEEVARLNAQRYGGATLYATGERWLDTALPDDSLLTVNGSDEFPAFEPIALAPLTQLVMTQPETGVFSVYSDPIQWELSTDERDTIELLVSSADATAASTETVKCWLNDSGEFVLPEQVRSVFSQNRLLMVSLNRARHTSYESDGAKLHISQSSYP